MAFRIFPEPVELLSFFGVEPTIFGDTVITYQREYPDETLYCSFSPDYGDIDLIWLQLDKQRLRLNLSYVQEVVILREKGREQLRATFMPATHLKEFMLEVEPRISIQWGTNLNKDL